MVDPEEHTSTATSGPKVLYCSICEKVILPEHGWTGGHNAHPVNNGRCCSDCNTKVVVPMRLQMLLAKRSPPG
jgi:hypothetical protein